jgi:hypothetical protein
MRVVYSLVARAAAITFFILSTASIVAAQNVVDPRFAEFAPSPDHDVVADGQPVVASYTLSLFLVGATTPFATVNLGKPSPGTDGLIRVDFLSLMTTPPAPGVVYVAHVSAVGPGGSGVSLVSNSFEFSAPCAPSINPAAQSFAAGGGSATVSVTTGSSCAWTATSSVSWISITSGASGTGNGSANFTVAAHTGTTSRTGTLTIAGQTFTVTQAAASCTYAIGTTSQSVPALGGTGSVGVTAGTGCTWTSTSNAGWITITSGGSGTGNGTANFTVAAHTGTTSRTGTLTIAGQTFTVTQSPVSCTYAIGSASQAVTSTGATRSVTVTAGTGCTWSSTSHVQWITINSGGNGSGNGTVSFTVAQNTTTSSRTGTLTIAGQTHTVTQAAMVCSYTVSSTSQAAPYPGGTYAVGLTTGQFCTWTATKSVAWITLSNASGTGSASIAYQVAANTTLVSRAGTISVGGRTVTVTQAAAVQPSTPSNLRVVPRTGGGL